MKTNANYGGEKEKFLSADQRRLLGLGPRCRWIRRHDGYLIRRRSEVRPEFWRSRQVIVERFIENRGHFFYRAHKVMDRVIISRMVNPAGIKKMLQQIRRTKTTTASAMSSTSTRLLSGEKRDMTTCWGSWPAAYSRRSAHRTGHLRWRRISVQF